MATKLSQSQFDAVRVELQTRYAVESGTVIEIAKTIKNAKHVADPTLWQWARGIERKHPFYTVIQPLIDKCSSSEGCTTAEFIAIIEEHHSRLPEEERPVLNAKYIKNMKGRIRNMCYKENRPFNLVRDWMRGSTERVEKRCEALAEAIPEVRKAVRKAVLDTLRAKGVSLNLYAFNGFVNDVIRSTFNGLSHTKPSIIQGTLLNKARNFIYNKVRSFF